MPAELELDRLFWIAMQSNPFFQEWLIQKSKFKSRRLRLLGDGTWHQRWYRDPVSKRESETDITLTFEDVQRNCRYAVHIENKPSGGDWRQFQAESYPLRALNRMSKWGHVDYDTALLAPQSFIDKSREEIRFFGFVLRYEDVAEFVPEFAVAAS